MPLFQARRRPRRLVVWLLSAALALPVAQTAATWHLVSLAAVGTEDAHVKPYSHPAHCDLCLAAAGLSSGAAAGAAAPAPAPPALHEAPSADSTPLVHALGGCAYRSRAPPSASA